VNKSNFDSQFLTACTIMSYTKCTYETCLWNHVQLRDRFFYNYRLWNQCLSPLKLWVRIPLMVKFTQYNSMW